MTTPLRRIGRRSSSPVGARARLPVSDDLEADRAVLRALQRSGVCGTDGLTCLLAAGELLATVRAARAPRPVEFHVTSGAATVHLEIDVTGFDGLNDAAIRSDAFPATRWGTVREHGRAALWAEVDRSTGALRSGDPAGFSDTMGDAVDAVAALLDVTTQLARARSFADITAVVQGPLCTHLGADAASLAIRDVSRSFTGSDPEHHTPGAGVRSRADVNDALVTVPVTVAGRPIGTLAVGWRGTRPVERLRPLLVIVARHSADAAIRVLSPPPGVTAMRPAGPRAPGPPGDKTDAADRPEERPATSVGRLRVDVVSRRVYVPGRSEPVRLTGREFELLLFLGEHVGTVQTRLQTLREVWGIDFRADTSVVDVTVSRLRRKLGAQTIVTIRDQGYMLLA